MILDDFNERVIQNIIDEFYLVKKEVPTCDKLLSEIKKRINFPWKVHPLRRLLKRMGYKWKKCQNMRKILIERPDIFNWRCMYLRAIRRYRELNRPLIFIDETWVDNNLTVRKCWQSESQPGVLSKTNSSNRLIVVHAGSENGFLQNSLLIFQAGRVTGDYHGQMDARNFEIWLRNQLLPNLPDNSVVIMDNAPYHSVQENKPPPKSAIKQDMISWLEKNNIPFSPDMRKPELYRLIEVHRRPEKIFKIDQILKSHGHDVLRLPPYMCEFNPIELAWAKVKRLLRENNVRGELSMQSLKEHTTNSFSCITREDWVGYCNHVKTQEAEYWQRELFFSIFNNFFG